MERLDDAGHLGSTKKRVFKGPRKKTFHLINSFKLQNTLSGNKTNRSMGARRRAKAATAGAQPGRGGNTTLDAERAVEIFLAKRRHKKR